MSEKDEGKSFIQEIIEDIRDTKELTDPEKNELVKVVEQAWNSEQDSACSSCPNLVRNGCPKRVQSDKKVLCHLHIRK
jgi:hypothetical protein